MSAIATIPPVRSTSSEEVLEEDSEESLEERFLKKFGPPPTSTPMLDTLTAMVGLPNSILRCAGRKCLLDWIVSKAIKRHGKPTKEERNQAARILNDLKSFEFIRDNSPRNGASVQVVEKGIDWERKFQERASEYEREHAKWFHPSGRAYAVASNEVAAA